jgi:endonuclease/exonuclease/phosphatase family metal-dependent hydrolase
VLRLFTANLLRGRAEPAALADQLGALGIDVACFQELGVRQAEAIARVLPHGKLDPSAPGAPDYHGMGIAARRPLDVHHLPLPDRDARVARLSPADWPTLGLPLEVVNVHVQAPHTFPQWRALALRRAQARGLCAHLDATPGLRRVVAGDFNATPLWPVYRALAARLSDLAVGHAERVGAPPRRTWGPWPGAPRCLRIDHALGNGVEAHDVRVLPIRGSDHSALVVDLALGD